MASRKQEIMKWFQTNVIWKPEALKDQAAFLAHLEKLANRYANPTSACSPWFREAKRYPGSR